MKLPSQLLLLTALLFTLSLSRTSLGGQLEGRTITCSSDNGRRNLCNVDTRGRVHLNRQISGSPCIHGQTWGWDSRGIWVDRGCRAEFIVGGGGNWGRGGAQGQIIPCSSNNNRRNLCSFPRRTVTLSRQISGVRCVQGQTWGWDDRGIWVDRGCHAEFLMR